LRLRDGRFISVVRFSNLKKYPIKNPAPLLQAKFLVSCFEGKRRVEMPNPYWDVIETCITQVYENLRDNAKQNLTAMQQPRNDKLKNAK